MFRKKPDAVITQDPELREAQSAPVQATRAPAVGEKLECALGVLAELREQAAEYALEAAERKPGAAEQLVGHRAKIEAAKTVVDELRAAFRLAAKRDKQAAAVAAMQMRADQLAEFKKAFAIREKSMAAVLKAAAEMSAAFGEYSEATVRGASVPRLIVGRRLA